MGGEEKFSLQKLPDHMCSAPPLGGSRLDLILPKNRVWKAENSNFTTERL